MAEPGLKETTPDVPHVPLPARASKVDEEITERERQAWAMCVRGWSRHRIAEALGVTYGAVCIIISRVQRRALAGLNKDVERVKIEQHARLEHIYDEAIQAWEKSKLPRKSGTKRTRLLPPDERLGGELVKVEEQTTQTMEERTGDLSYLREAREALADQRKLWGLDAPVKIEGPNGGPGVLVINTIEAQPPKVMPPDEYIEVEARTRDDDALIPPDVMPVVPVEIEVRVPDVGSGGDED